MIAAAIIRMLKFDPLIRMIAGVVSVADTRYSVTDTVTHPSKLHARSHGWMFRCPQVISFTGYVVNSCGTILRRHLRKQSEGTRLLRFRLLGEFSVPRNTPLVDATV